MYGGRGGSPTSPRSVEANGREVPVRTLILLLVLCLTGCGNPTLKQSPLTPVPPAPNPAPPPAPTPNAPALPGGTLNIWFNDGFGTLIVQAASVLSVDSTTKIAPCPVIAGGIGAGNTCYLPTGTMSLAAIGTCTPVNLSTGDGSLLLETTVDGSAAVIALSSPLITLTAPLPRASVIDLTAGYWHSTCGLELEGEWYSK